MIRIRRLRTLFLGLGALSLLNGQVGPTVDSQLRASNQHPHGLDPSVETIVFGPATGNCSDDFIQILHSDFVESGVQVIDRRNLDLILQRHGIRLAGSVDQATAAELGRIIGPASLLIVRITRCSTDQQRLTRTKERIIGRGDETSRLEFPVYVSITKADLRISMRAVDLQTGRTVAARSIYRAPQRSVESDMGYPDYPSDLEVLDEAYASAAMEVHTIFLPWTETSAITSLDGMEEPIDSGPDHTFELPDAGIEVCTQ